MKLFYTILWIISLLVIVFWANSAYGQTLDTKGYETKVKIFKTVNDPGLLERKVNTFLEEFITRCTILEIEYVVATMGGYATRAERVYSVIIIYKLE